MWRSGGLAAVNFNVATRWSPSPLHSEIRPQYAFSRGLCGYQSRSGGFREEINLFRLPGFEPRFHGCPLADHLTASSAAVRELWRCYEQLFGGSLVEPSWRRPVFSGAAVTMRPLRFPFLAPRPRLYRSSSLEIVGISVGRKNKNIFWLSRRIVILLSCFFIFNEVCSLA